MKAIFLDRDGTINAGIPFFDRVDSADKVQILDGAIAGLAKLAKLEYMVFLVTNQAGIAEGLITRAEFDAINNKVLELIKSTSIKIVETLVCPHGEGSTCDCRKPKPGMLLDAAKKYGIDLNESWVIGDRETDIETGINAGTKTILVTTGDYNGDGSKANHVSKTLLDAVRFITQNS